MTSVKDIYERIKRNIYLYISDLNKKFTIHTDASEFAIGADRSSEGSSAACQFTTVDRYTTWLFDRDMLICLEEPLVFMKSLLIKDEDVKEFGESIYLIKSFF
ncbi:hypothetical protein DMUE_6072, partial [Dictyocoela muelleri]